MSNSHTQNQPKHYSPFSYIPHTLVVPTNRLKRKYGVTPVSANERNLQTLLVNNKESPKVLDSREVYQVQYNDCSDTTFPKKKRIIECDKSIVNKKCNTGFAKHCIIENHALDTDNVKLLHQSSKRKVLNLLEAIEIKKAEKQKINMTNE